MGKEMDFPKAVRVTRNVIKRKLCCGTFCHYGTFWH